MNKKILALLWLSITSGLYAQEQSKSYDDHLAEHAKAFEEVTPFIPKLTCETKVIYNGNHAQTLYFYFGEPAAKAAWSKYQAAQAKLSLETIKHSTGDGFIMGAGLAAAQKFLGGSEVTPWSVLTIFISSIVLKLYQNKQIDPVPYYDQLLQRKEDYFAQLSLATTGNILCSMTGATAGFVGALYTLNKLAELRR